MAGGWPAFSPLFPFRVRIGLPAIGSPALSHYRTLSFLLRISKKWVPHPRFEAVTKLKIKVTYSGFADNEAEHVVVSKEEIRVS